MASSNPLALASDVKHDLYYCYIMVYWHFDLKKLQKGDKQQHEQALNCHLAILSPIIPHQINQVHTVTCFFCFGLFSAFEYYYQPVF